MNRRERHNIAIKKREWERDMRPINAWWKKQRREIKSYTKLVINWYLFYQPKDTTDKIWHLMLVIIVDVMALRVFGLI